MLTAHLLEKEHILLINITKERKYVFKTYNISKKIKINEMLVWVIYINIVHYLLHITFDLSDDVHYFPIG